MQVKVFMQDPNYLPLPNVDWDAWYRSVDRLPVVLVDPRFSISFTSPSFNTSLKLYRRNERTPMGFVGRVYRLRRPAARRPSDQPCRYRVRRPLDARLVGAASASRRGPSLPSGQTRDIDWQDPSSRYARTVRRLADKTPWENRRACPRSWRAGKVQRSAPRDALPTVMSDAGSPCLGPSARRAAPVLPARRDPVRPGPALPVVQMPPVGGR